MLTWGGRQEVPITGAEVWKKQSNLLLPCHGLQSSSQSLTLAIKGVSQNEAIHVCSSVAESRVAKDGSGGDVKETGNNKQNKPVTGRQISYDLT